jgi:hypothetical protein
VLRLLLEMTILGTRAGQLFDDGKPGNFRPARRMRCPAALTSPQLGCSPLLCMVVLQCNPIQVLVAYTSVLSADSGAKSFQTRRLPPYAAACWSLRSLMNWAMLDCRV